MKMTKGKTINAKCAEIIVVGEKAEIIAVRATGKDGVEHHLDFPTTTTTQTITTTTLSTTSTTLPPEQIKDLEDVVEVNKKFLSKFGGQASLAFAGIKLDFSFNFERSPEKTTHKVKEKLTNNW